MEPEDRALLEQALERAFPHAKFEGLTGTRIGEAYGFASRLIRMRWREEGEWKSAVVKTWPLDGRASDREIRFFRTFPDVGLRTPACYFSSADTASNRGLLILEDVSHAAQGDVLKLLDRDTARALAQSLATLHRKWLNHPELSAHHWIEDQTEWRPNREWLIDRRDRFFERFPGRLTGPAVDLLHHTERLPNVVRTCLSDAPTTLNHGDFHLDNLMFEAGPTPIFLDWTRPVRGTPAANCATLFFYMTDLAHFDSLIDTYLAQNQELDRPQFETMLSGELIRTIVSATCGVVKWIPQTERERQIIELGIEQANRAAEFWLKRNPTWLDLS